MREFSDLNRAIGPETSPWHDYNREIAWEVVSRLSAEAWASLSEYASLQPEYWQIRCIDAIGNEVHAHSVEAFKSFLLSDNVEVASMAANALAVDAIVLPKEFEGRLVKLVEDTRSRTDGAAEDAQELLKIT